MERVTIAVHVPLKAAVMNGQDQYGPATLLPTEQQLSSLSFDEKRVLMRFVIREGWEDKQRRLRIRTAPPTWEGVVEAIRRMVANQDNRQREKESTSTSQQSRDHYVEAAALILRERCRCSKKLSDQEVIEHAIPALMEEVLEEITARCHLPADQIRILSVECSEYRRMSISQRTEYSVTAANLLRDVTEVMMQTLPHDDGVFIVETSVVRVRHRSLVDGIARRPSTFVIGEFFCAASSPTVLLVRAEPPAEWEPR